MKAEDMSPEALRALADKIEKKRKNARPQPRTEPITDEWDSAVAFTESILKCHEDPEGESYVKDKKHWAYEILMELVYGKGVWKWMNDNPNKYDYD